jgi:hypothetical protein
MQSFKKQFRKLRKTYNIRAFKKYFATQLYEKYVLRIKNYKPEKLEKPCKILHKISAWEGLEKIIADIIRQSNCGTEKCLEFGVEYGYSTVVFSNYFDQVTGVDIFTGDEHTANHDDIYDEVKESLSAYENIKLIRADYRDFIHKNTDNYNFIHVDIVHTYEDTFKCGLWSALHAKCVIFHDTESFPDVKRAVYDIAKQSGKTFYNYPHFYGLGILY